MLFLYLALFKDNKLVAILCKFEHMKSLHYAILIIGSLAGAFLCIRITRYALKNILYKYSKSMKEDPTSLWFINSAINFIFISIALFFIASKIPFLSSLGKTLFAGAGVLAAVIGFASQKAFSNIISGVFILLFKPFKIGDTVQIENGMKGEIEEISLRHTSIRNYENLRIIIPNSIISDQLIINSDIEDNRVSKHLFIDISYDSKIDKAVNIIREQALKHPNLIDARTQKEKSENLDQVVVRVVELGSYYIRLRANVWASNTGRAFELHCDLLKSIKEKFEEEGVEIPYPHQVEIHKEAT